jgi:hypothetical protein
MASKDVVVEDGVVVDAQGMHRVKYTTIAGRDLPNIHVQAVGGQARTMSPGSAATLRSILTELQEEEHEDSEDEFITVENGSISASVSGGVKTTGDGDALKAQAIVTPHRVRAAKHVVVKKGGHFKVEASYNGGTW